MLVHAAPLEPAQQIGQKLIVDLRYFCTDGTSSQSCRTPFTHVNATNRPAITRLLTQNAISGVILFSENIISASQLVRLNYELQMIMRRAGLPALFIAIDQEGGRVARLPDSMAVRFSGNMAIGATYPAMGTQFARDVAAGMATTLHLLGINVNFAPSLDVNVNPDNPVINVRSYGEDPAMVAKLGEAAVRAMQQRGVISAVKHFPGHGDTHVDSHSGLPRVMHDRSIIDRQDLLPFRRVIRDAAPGMVMTAHIQYPELDDTTILGRNGKKTIVPATMSAKILTGILRDTLGYNGLIVSDAMDMAGIAAHFTPAQALTSAFDAGVDLALMPYPLRTPADITTLYTLQEEVATAQTSVPAGQRSLIQSLSRIGSLKKHYVLSEFTSMPLTARLSQVDGVLPLRSNQALDRALSAQSLTHVTTGKRVTLDKHSRWLFVMPDAAHCQAAKAAAIAKQVKADCLSYFALPEAGRAEAAVQEADVVIVGDITPQHAMYETGGLDPAVPRASAGDQQTWLQALLAHIATTSKTSVFVAMRVPYTISQVAPLVDMSIATYFYNVSVTGDQAHSVMFDSLTDVLLGKKDAPGQLPVTVKPAPTH